MAVSAGAYVAMAFGVLVGGVLLDRLGLRPVYTLVAGTLLVCALSMLGNPAFRALDAPPAGVTTLARREARAV